jgi:hypothetical protein
MISMKSFSEKMIFSKIFFGVWFARKNYEMQKSEFGKCRRNPATSSRRCRIPARKFDRIRPKSSGFGRINGRIMSYPAWPFLRDPAG